MGLARCPRSAGGRGTRPAPPDPQVSGGSPGSGGGSAVRGAPPGEGTAQGREAAGPSVWAARKGEERREAMLAGPQKLAGPGRCGAERGRARCGHCGGRGAPGARSALRREKENALADAAVYFFDYYYFFLPSVLARGRGGGGRAFGRFKLFLRRSRCRKPRTENLLLAP